MCRYVEFVQVFALLQKRKHEVSVCFTSICRFRLTSRQYWRLKRAPARIFSLLGHGYQARLLALSFFSHSSSSGVISSAGPAASSPSFCPCTASVAVSTVSGGRAGVLRPLVGAPLEPTSSSSLSLSAAGMRSRYVGGTVYLEMLVAYCKSSSNGTARESSGNVVTDVSNSSWRSSASFLTDVLSCSSRASASARKCWMRTWFAWCLATAAF